MDKIYGWLDGQKNKYMKNRWLDGWMERIDGWLGVLKKQMDGWKEG